MMNEKELLLKSVRKNAFILAVFAIASTALVSIVHQLTKNKIESEVQRVVNQRLNKLVDSNLYDNSPINDCILIKDYSKKNQTSIHKVHLMKKNNLPMAMVFTSTAHDGYSGNIDLLIALSNDNRLLGIEILSHRETPGLGDKIESNKSNWLQQFKSISLADMNEKNWRVKKDGVDFDTLTGATITPRAIINATYDTSRYFSGHKQELFNKVPNCEEK
jgi:electron transport complex protein RnfG